MMYSENGSGERKKRQKLRKSFGLLEWFQMGDEKRVEEVLADAAALGVTEIRTGFSWADFMRKEGPAWYDWLLPRLRREVDVLPCFTYTPPSEGIVAKVSSPPREPKRFADFLDVAITRYGEHFEWVELWNEPNGLIDWDWRLDPSWNIFSEMIRGAAYWARQRGKKTVLGGMCPTDQNWLELMAHREVLKDIDVVGIHGFPGTWEFDWTDWGENIRRVQEVLNRHRLKSSIWITEVGYSTWRHDGFAQLRQFNDVMEAGAERVYWYSVRDLKPDQAHQEGFRQDDRHYHLGLKTAEGTPKLLFRILEKEGIEGVRTLAAAAQSTLPPIYTMPMATRNGRKEEVSPRARPRAGSNGRYTLITGGAGFIGTNLADRLLSAGEAVMIFDNLSRPGVEENLRWLREKYPQNLRVEIADVRDPYLLNAAVKEAGHVFHFAAQVAVTTSMNVPRTDFEINASGTLNLLEAIRACDEPPPLVFTSTNKVYGPLAHLRLHKETNRYQPIDASVRRHGIDEEVGLCFQSPYGCSKGAADQYVLDYATSFRLPAAVFRMSCIYGPHQFGTEDQGWVAHFLMRALSGEPVTIYGDGLQVRDVLFVEDLVDAFQSAQARMAEIRGQAFNIGGGPDNTVSLLELIDLIRELHEESPALVFDEWRPADQYFYVSDLRKFSRATGWTPSTRVADGLAQLYQWLRHGRSGSVRRVRPARRTPAKRRFSRPVPTRGKN